MKSIFFVTTAGIIMILAVLIGAFGAHGLAPYMNDAGKLIFQTGSKYHFFHGLALWMALLLSYHFKTDRLHLVFYLFLMGIICFSGSLYLLSIREHLPEVATKILGPLTPIGGLLFISGWTVLTIRLRPLLLQKPE